MRARRSKRMEPFFLSVRIVVGTACVLSVGGACLIILTFVAFKDLRTLARQQLVNLSVADILVAGSHLLGLAALRVENYTTRTDVISVENITNAISNATSNATFTDPSVLCQVQAFFTMFGTIASFLWSLALGFYMLMIIVMRRPDIARYLLVFYYPVCWMVPLGLSLWFALENPTYLGYAKNSDIGKHCLCLTTDYKNSVGLYSQDGVTAGKDPMQATLEMLSCICLGTDCGFP